MFITKKRFLRIQKTMLEKTSEVTILNAKLERARKEIAGLKNIKMDLFDYMIERNIITAFTMNDGETIEGKVISNHKEFIEVYRGGNTLKVLVPKSIIRKMVHVK